MGKLRPIISALSLALASMGVDAADATLPVAAAGTSTACSWQGYGQCTDAFRAQVSASWNRPAGLESATGANVIVAVLDTGVRASHPAFVDLWLSPEDASRLNRSYDSLGTRVLSGYNAIANTLGGADDDNGHGTHVAGIIAGGSWWSEVSGVAHRARILPVKVLAANGAGDLANLDRALLYTIGRSGIVNLSLGWGSSQQGFQSVFQRQVDAGQLLVIAAGNEGKSKPSYPGRFAKEIWAKGQILVVGAVDANNQILSFSNRAGDALNFYLVAPGQSISSAWNDGGTHAMSGTSMATPFVSGAAALLSSAWPHLASSQIADILLRTATDLGDPGVDAIYGRGLLNVERALEPVGETTVATSSGAVAAARAAFNPGSSYVAAVLAAGRAGAFRVVGQDEFGRGYAVDLGTAVRSEAGLSAIHLFGVADAHTRLVELGDRHGRRLAFTLGDVVTAAPGLWLPDSARPRTWLTGMLLSERHDDLEWSVGTGGFARYSFGPAGTPIASTGLAGRDSLTNPFFNLVPSSTHLALHHHLPDGWQWRAGLLTGRDTLNHTQGYEPRLPLRGNTLGTRGSALTMPYRRRLDSCGKATACLDPGLRRGSASTGRREPCSAISRPPCASTSEPGSPPWRPPASRADSTMAPTAWSPA
ncbi:MAG: S8 family serine peptidase [Betaproteobacteria bacterium]|nr:S8 family serine peptidase [Betaproteobacteria bacterium]